MLGILLVSIPHLIDTQISSSQNIGAQTAEQSPQPSIAFSPASVSPRFVSAATGAAVTYDVQYLPYSVVHWLRMPANMSFHVTPALAEKGDALENFAAAGAIGAVNGGFFDPINQKTTSYVVLNGEVVADPAENERLVNNPEMLPYLDRILDRSEFRQYRCGPTIRYEIATHSEPVPVNCQLLTALGAGPRLLPQLSLVEEGFAEIIDGEWVRDALGSTQPNARTAVGITAEGDVLLVMVAQLPERPTDSGMSLPELAEFMQTLGVEAAMNLDGGSSSALYYQGQTYYGKVDRAGNPVERPVKSVLLVQDLLE